jgi:uncharacterized protein YcbX
LPSRGRAGAVGIVADLWRFPVKSFGGERVRRAFLGPFGMLGDRRHAVVDATSGETLTARRVSRLLGFRARYLDSEAAASVAVETPDGLTLGVDDPELATALGKATGRPVSIERHPAGFHDAAALHLVTQSSLATLGEWLDTELDSRRFRPNVVVELETPQPFVEDGWPGRRLTIGAVEIDVVVPTERCAVTTFDPDTLDRSPEVLAALARGRDNLFGVYARILTPGWIAVGDTVRETVATSSAGAR